MPHGAVERSQHGGAKGDLFDDTDRFAKIDDITNSVLVFQQHKKSGNAVLNEALRAETECNACNAGAGDQRAEVDADRPKRRGEANAPYRNRYRRTENVGNRKCTGLATLSDERVFFSFDEACDWNAEAIEALKR